MKTHEFSIFTRITSLCICTLLLFSCMACKKSPKKTESEYWLSYYEDGEGAQAGDGSGVGGNEVNGSSGVASNGVAASGGTVLNRKNYSICSSGFPIVTKGTATLSVMLPADTYDTATSGFAKTYEKMTGVKVKYSYYKASDIFSIKTTLIKSGNRPDVFLAPPVGFSTGELESYSKDGMIVDLQSYLNTWGANIKSAVEDSLYVTGNKLLGLPIVSSRDGVDNDKYSESQMYINQKWLNALGLSVPQTTTDLANVLDAFVNQDPDGNGQNDTYGMGLVSFRPQMWNPWGLNMSWYFLGSTDETGQTDWGPLTDQYREGILYYKDLWDRGLISKEVLNAGTDSVCNKYMQKCGVMVGRVPSDIVSESRYNDWIAMATPVGSNTGNYMGGISESFGTSGAVKNGYGYPNIGVVFSSCKDVEMAVRWLDYFYTQDGSMLAAYGPEGKAYQKTSSGYKLYKNVDTLKDGQYIGTAWFPSIANCNIIQRAKSEMTAKEIANADYTSQYNSANRWPKYSYRNLSEFRTYEEIQEMKDWSLPDCEWGYNAIRGEVNIQTEWNSYTGKYAAARQNLQTLFNESVFSRAYK